MKAARHAHPAATKHRRFKVASMLDRLGEDFEVFSDRADDAIERDALIEALAARCAGGPGRSDLH